MDTCSMQVVTIYGNSFGDKSPFPLGMKYKMREGVVPSCL